MENLADELITIMDDEFQIDDGFLVVDEFGTVENVMESLREKNTRRRVLVMEIKLCIWRSI